MQFGYVLFLIGTNISQGVATVLGYHEHSIAKALVDLYPDIGLVRAKLHC
jgi:hypothetical protein